MTKQTRQSYRDGRIIDVVEYHDDNRGAPGEKRQRKTKATSDAQTKINTRMKTLRCRQKLLTYFSEGDLFITLTYRPEERPASMTVAKANFAKFVRRVRDAYKKQQQTLYWIRNIELKSDKNWHIHMVINEIDGTYGIVEEAWEHGFVNREKIRTDANIYDEDFYSLTDYLTKDENSPPKNDDERIIEASYSTSRNMPLPEPEIEKLIRYPKEPEIKDGYRIVRYYEGIDPVTGYQYRKFTMAAIDKNKTDKHKGEV